MASDQHKVKGDVTPKPAEEACHHDKGGECVYDVSENKNKNAVGLTIKALDPFSPFISLASDIKHARETKYWVRFRHNIPLSRALIN